jgi:hypothetical protein
MTAMSQSRVMAARGLVTFAALGLMGLVYQLLLVYVGPHAWDDGAITLAYARTLAETGRFALTPVSEVVEGASSLLFVGGMAALQGLHAWSFDGLIRASQWVALLAWMATLVLMDRKLRFHVPHAGQRLLLLGLLAVLPMPMAEVFNGMEMSTFALILLGVVEAFERRHAALWLLIPLALLVRFEAAFYLGFAFAGLVLCRPRDRRWAWGAGAYVVAIWLFLAWWRFQVFDDWMPNTIRAKMHAPYMPAGHGLALLQAKAEGLMEFLKVNAAWLLTLAWLWRRAAPVRAGAEGGQTWQRWDIKVWLVLAFAVFGALTGANWGYQGRMCLAALPLLVLMVAERWTVMRAMAGGERRPVLHTAGWALVGLSLATAVVNANVALGDAKAVMRGAYYQGYLPPALQARTEAHMRSGQVEFAHWMGVTPANFRATGLVVDRVRASLGLKEIALLTPDVGGLSLCCRQIRVLDFGLLTSRELAHSGYAGLGAYLNAQQADLIITHTFWSELSGIYALPAFDRQYVPVVVSGMHMWLRKDHLSRLLRSPMWRASTLEGPQALTQTKYGGKPTDLAYVQSRGAENIWAFSEP